MRNVNRGQELDAEVNRDSAVTVVSRCSSSSRVMHSRKSKDKVALREIVKVSGKEARCNNRTANLKVDVNGDF